jgi:hypothetical protein
MSLVRRRLSARSQPRVKFDSRPAMAWARGHEQPPRSPTVTLSADAMNVRIPKQETPRQTGKVLVYTGAGLLVLGLLYLAASS